MCRRRERKANDNKKNTFRRHLLPKYIHSALSFVRGTAASLWGASRKLSHSLVHHSNTLGPHSRPPPTNHRPPRTWTTLKEKEKSLSLFLLVCGIVERKPLSRQKSQVLVRKMAETVLGGGGTFVAANDSRSILEAVGGAGSSQTLPTASAQTCMTDVCVMLHSRQSRQIRSRW